MDEMPADPFAYLPRWQAARRAHPQGTRAEYLATTEAAARIAKIQAAYAQFSAVFDAILGGRRG